MISISLLFSICFLILLKVTAQTNIRQGWYRAELLRTDGVSIPFNFEARIVNGKWNLYIRNATERIKVDQISFKKDSVFIQMPVFESRFKAKIMNNGSLRGEWTRGSASSDIVLSFTATPATEGRFPIHQKP